MLLNNIKQASLLVSSILLNARQIKMHEEAKRYCVYFIIGLQTDPTLDRLEKNRSTQIVVERYIQLKTCVYGDEIVTFAKEQDLEDILHFFKIGVRIIEDVYKDKNFTVRAY